MCDEKQYYEATKRNLVRDLNDPTARETFLEQNYDLKVERVLDIGCGIGQALYPLAVRTGAFGVGIDISDYSVNMGREYYADNLPDANVTFVNARAEELPFPSASFDLVNCGLALPYTHNPRAIAEVERVLRPGGLFLLKIHHLRYYLLKLRQALYGANLLSMIHSVRVLTAGTVYHLSRRQPMSRILNETYQTKWLLKRELARHGMFIDREQPDADSAAPAYVIRRTGN